MAIEFPDDKKLVLFDGVCNLCNNTVTYLIKRDKKDVFRFAPLQSDVGQQIIKHYNIDTSKIDSILFYSKDKGVSYKSTAALKIAASIGFPQNLMTAFYIIPPVIRNWFYDYIAKNRYKWYGKKESCMIPTPELKNKFL